MNGYSCSYSGNARSVSPDEGTYVALTFDEGPSSYTAQIIDILEEKGVSATFFLQGDRTADAQSAAAAIVDAGFEVGSNSWSDTDLGELSADDLRVQLTEGFEAIEDATGQPCCLLRPPYGTFTDQNWADAADLVSAVVTWNIDSGDYLLPGADQVVETVVGSVSNGSIVLLTDNDACGAQTVEALPQIIDQLQEEGYRIVSLSELVKTDEELAEAVDLSRVSMPEDAVLPQLKAEDTEES